MAITRRISYQMGPILLPWNEKLHSKTADATIKVNPSLKEACLVIREKFASASSILISVFCRLLLCPPFKATALATLHLFSSSSIRSYHSDWIFYPSTHSYDILIKFPLLPYDTPIDYVILPWSPFYDLSFLLCASYVILMGVSKSQIQQRADDFARVLIE